jgi:hypothetical protein
MATMRGRRRKGKESVSGYFRQIFIERPELLGSTSNQELLERWKADHGTNDVPNSVRSNLANLKSHLRKRQRLGLSLGGKVASRSDDMPLRRTSSNGLEALEEHIDDSLTLAKNLDRSGLAEVIILLRKARNKVVWKLGE